MPNFTIALAELVYCATCQTCGKSFYLWTDPEDSIPSNSEVLEQIEDWHCPDHPAEQTIAELTS